MEQILQKSYAFSLFAPEAKEVTLCLFSPDKEIPMKGDGGQWHITVDDIPPTARYAFKIADQLLLDPYAKHVDGTLGIVDPHPTPFDWEEMRAPNIPLDDLIIYEMHLAGFTKDPSSNVKHPGTYLGLIEKIPYLQKLGINAVELMPIHTFGDSFWGYSTLNFFSPHAPYANNDPIHECKTLVKALHKAGIEVILDVVYNHTCEGNEHGPTLSYKGLANSTYYMLTEDGHYYNFSGCGNTLNANDPIVTKLICDSLRYWVTEMHVDGFRFDLASCLTRGPDGTSLESPPLIEHIANDPILAKTKLIAEAWDAGGLYQVGSFPCAPRFSEWNGQYRDTIRRFIKGTDGQAGPFATRLAGSSDLYQSPTQSINYVTCHDGFTLNDLVSYNEKQNPDGDAHNESWNCGHEGATEDRDINALRLRQMKNFTLALFLSQGIPMLYMGDEYGHTKNGNNNTWNIDGPISWFNWNETENELFDFVRQLIGLRKTHFPKNAEITWHGVYPGEPDWSHESRLVAFTRGDLYIAFNAHHYEMTLHLPEGKYSQLLYSGDTSALQGALTLAPYSSIVLEKQRAETSSALS